MTIKEILSAFPGQPLCLAAVLLAGMVSVMTYLAMTGQRQMQHEQVLRLIDRCGPATSPP
jgi:hypothetical protein